MGGAHGQSHDGPSCDPPGNGQPVFVCMLSARHLQFMDTDAGKVPGFFLFTSPFSFLCNIFCSSEPECPKKRGLPLCSEYPALLECCPSLGLLNRSAEPQEGRSTFRNTLPEAQKSSESPDKDHAEQFCH